METAAKSLQQSGSDAKKCADFEAHFATQLSPVIGKKIIVAVSGGADSMCLLLLLLRILPEVSKNLLVCHYNHQLRGKEAEADADFVRSFCEQRGIRFRAGQGDVAGQARLQKKSIESMARLMRYAFFAQVAAEEGAEVLALAHHLEDQAESLLLHLVRGAGLDGLCGMAPCERRGSLLLWRPLLSFQKKELLFYLKAKGVSYREDATNAQREALRNGLRLDIFPQLQKTVHPSVMKKMAQCAALLQADRAALDEWAQEILHTAQEPLVAEEKTLRFASARCAQVLLGARVLRKKPVCNAPKAVALRLLRRVLREEAGTAAELTQPILEEIYALFFSEVGKRKAFYGKILLSDSEYIWIYKARSVSTPEAAVWDGRGPFSATWRTGSEVIIGGWADAFPSAKERRNPNRCYFDGSGAFPIVLRAAKAGESLRRFSGPAIALRRLFNEKGVRVPIRQGWPVAESGGKILAVLGLERSDAGTVQANTSRVAYLEWRCQ